MTRGPLRWLTERPIAHRGLHDAGRGIPENSLAAFEAARNASAGGENSPAPDRVARQVSRAETLFERAMAAAGGGDLGLTPAGDAARIAEIEAMRRDAAVAERLAALRAGPAGS